MQVSWNWEKVYDNVNSETLWQVLRTYDVVGKFLNSIRPMYVNNLVNARAKVGESEFLELILV